MRKQMTHIARTAWLRIAAAVLVGQQLAWFLLRPITVLGSVSLGLVVLLACLLLLGSRVAWVLAGFLAVSQLTAPFTLGEPIWFAALAAVVLAGLLAPSSWAFIWTERKRRASGLSWRKKSDRMYGRLLALADSTLRRLPPWISRGKLIVLLVVGVLIARPLVGALYDFHHGSARGNLLIDVVWRVVWIGYSLAELAAIVLVVMTAYRYLTRRIGGGSRSSTPRGPDQGVAGHVLPQRQSDALDPDSASQPNQVRDPRAYPDQDRPAGWYVDPSDPVKMRYWRGGSLGWVGTTRTPREIRQAWQ
jgi:hypothetical protein